MNITRIVAFLLSSYTHRAKVDGLVEGIGLNPNGKGVQKVRNCPGLTLNTLNPTGHIQWTDEVLTVHSPETCSLTIHEIIEWAVAQREWPTRASTRDIADFTKIILDADGIRILYADDALGVLIPDISTKLDTKMIIEVITAFTGLNPDEHAIRCRTTPLIYWAHNGQWHWR